MLPDDGPVRPKHVGVILKLILICVEGLKCKFNNTLVQIVGFIICISRVIARYRNSNDNTGCYYFYPSRRAL